MKKTTAIHPLNLYGQGAPLTLPVSGLTVQVRAFNIHDYLRQGHIPARLQAQVLDIFQNGLTQASFARGADDMIQFMDLVLLACLIGPRATDDPAQADADTVYIGHIPPADRLAIFTAGLRQMQQTADALRPLSETATPSGV